MTTPKPTPERNSATPDVKADYSSTPERDGFFRRVRRELNPEPLHPSEAQEIVIMPGEPGEGNGERLSDKAGEGDDP